ncbi:hypothetical protein [Ornithinicoccus halotolerans]|uniref:hypothetical protein n=1 Tax=Ornithinicoccus halotolerans TaxID=1748220 RepID=UPI001E55514B|nr:hypothetical protein [Ornithinicoccus halotolerans]
MALLHRSQRDDPLEAPAGPLPGGAEQAFWLLRAAFTVAPILFGLDKFANVLVDWPAYLAPWVDGIVPGTAQQAMWAVGVVEVVAGLVVAWRPVIGGVLVALWLAGIIVNLVSTGSYLDVALRDVGLLAGALALALLARSRTEREPVTG